MFKKVTKFIANQADPSKTLMPVESFADQEHFKVSHLLEKKRKRATIFHPAPYYQQTGFSLDDVLLPEDGKSTVHTSDEVDGDVNVSVVPASVEVKGGASSSKKFSITLQKKARPLKSLEPLSRKRKMNMDHSFIRQVQGADLDLYIVYETLEASEEAEFKESSRAGGSIMADIYAFFFGKATTDSEKVIAIPKGCTLAFRAIQLSINNGEWQLDFVQGLPARTAVYSAEDNVEIFLGPQRNLELVEGEVEQYCAIFSELSSGLLVVFLNAITAVMRDRDLFQELSQTMENFLEENGNYKLKTESTALKDLLSTLENSAANRRVRLAAGINYTLDALAELLDDQLLLLLASLQRKIVSQQLKLVGNLLEHVLEKGNEPFSVDASLLSFPGQEEQSITMALVGLSGVKLQGDGSAVPTEQPFEAVAALYVALHVLSLLSASE